VKNYTNDFLIPLQKILHNIIFFFVTSGPRKKEKYDDGRRE